MQPYPQRFGDSGHEAAQQQTQQQTQQEAPVEEALTREEMILLTILRTSRQYAQEMFNDRELARLRFVRWLVETGRLSR
jgi:hypothetical protein